VWWLSSVIPAMQEADDVIYVLLETCRVELQGLSASLEPSWAFIWPSESYHFSGRVIPTPQGKSTSSFSAMEGLD
jgi:hypothetical protein